MAERFELLGVDVSNTDNVVLVFMSIAISLKRMADILEEAWTAEKRGDPPDGVGPHAER